MKKKAVFKYLKGANDCLVNGTLCYPPRIVDPPENGVIARFTPWNHNYNIVELRIDHLKDATLKDNILVSGYLTINNYKKSS